MHILVAPNAFKSAITATQAGEAIANGLRQANSAFNIVIKPIADGGDGSLEILCSYLQAQIRFTSAIDPLGRKIQVRWGITPDKKVGIIELAEASGIRLLSKNEFDPQHATTFGTGQVIREAVTHGCTELIIGVGGSATVDGGFGILKALGAKFYANHKKLTTETLFDAVRADEINIERPLQLLNHTKITILADVNNRLLGERGTVKVFGLQKGVKPNEIPHFEKAMSHWADLLNQHMDNDVRELISGGASGGVPAGLSVLPKVTVHSGAKHILELGHFETAIKKSDLVITCEGQLDQQTREGKAPAELAKHCHKLGKPIIGLFGKIEGESGNNLFTKTICINEKFTSIEDAIFNTSANLTRSAFDLGNTL